ncbi:MAG: flavodoxin family protein [Planctomycetia bacterium]|jgi:multimeric flavodoxin WrbA
MKVLGISGSPRKGGNTDTLINLALDTMAAEGFETEFLSVPPTIKPCIACCKCRQMDEVKCAVPDPAFDGMIEKFVEADGILLGSPVYFGSATPQIMALLDRVGYVTRPRNLMRRKVGASIVVARRAGHNFTFAQLNYFFLLNEMIVPGSTYWNMGTAAAPGEVNEDAEAVTTIKNLATNMAWVMKKIV